MFGIAGAVAAYTVWGAAEEDVKVYADGWEIGGLLCICAGVSFQLWKVQKLLAIIRNVHLANFLLIDMDQSNESYIRWDIFPGTLATETE